MVFIKSLSSKIAFSVLAITLITGLLATYIGYSFSVKQLLDEQHKDLTVNSTIQSEKTSQIFYFYQALTRRISEQSLLKLFLNSPNKFTNQQLVAIFKEFDINHQYSTVFLMDINGNVLASSDQQLIGQNYGFRDYFQQSLKGQDFIDLAVGVTTKQLGYYFSSPVYLGDKIIGVLVGKLDPSIVNDSISSSITSHNSIYPVHYMLSDINGVIVYSDNSNRLFSSLGKIDPAKLTELEAAKTYYQQKISPLAYQSVQDELPNIDKIQFFNLYDPVDKEEEVIVATKVSGSPLFLIAEFSKEDIAAPLNRSVLLILGLSVLVIFIAFILINTLVNKLINPLATLSTIAQKIGQGQDVGRFNIKTGDEIEILASSFNDMVDNLIKAKASTEQQVKERTRDLDRLNKYLVGRELKMIDLKRQLVSLLPKSEHDTIGIPVNTIDQKTNLSEITGNDQQKALLNVLEELSQSKSEIEKEKAKSDALIGSVGEGVIAVDQDSRIIFVNQTACDLLGFKSSELIGNSFHKSVTVFDDKEQPIAENQRPFYNSIKNKTKVSISAVAPYYYLKKDKTKIPVSITINPIVVNGEVVGAIDVFRDVTHEHEVDRMKTEFISLASHQLRTPLSAMKWFLEMLISGDAGQLSQEQQTFVQNIYQSNQRLIALVNALLNISRIESGRIIVDPEPTNMAALATQAVNDVKPLCDEKNQKIDITIDPKLPVINIDPKLISEIFKNLLSNAIKYSPNQSTIALKLTQTKNDVVAQISDTGYGVPASAKNKIFEKFYRASNILKLDTDGNGLGLYLVKAIIDSSGGKIWFESQEGKGTTFWFSLPLSGSKAKQGQITINN